MVQRTIDDLLRDHLAVLSSNKTNEDGERKGGRGIIILEYHCLPFVHSSART